MENETNVSITEIDNGYMVHASKSGYVEASFGANRAVTGPKNDPKTAEELLQFVCEEILFKLMNRSKTFGGSIHGHVKVFVSFTEDPANPVEAH